MFRLRYLAFAFIVLAPAFYVDDASAQACYACRSSPNNFQFCRSDLIPYSYCTEQVADPWTGRTRCIVPSEIDCGPEEGGVTDGPGDPGEPIWQTEFIPDEGMPTCLWWWVGASVDDLLTV